MKKTIKNKKLLLGLGAIISITSITSILSCSKPNNDSPTYPDSNGGSNGVKPEPNPEPEDGKQYLNIQNHKFDTGNESWADHYNFLPQIEINKIRWVDQQNKPIKYKVRLQINPGRILGNEHSNENKLYNLKTNFYKKMDTGLDLEFIFWIVDREWFSFEIEPLNWEPKKKRENDISLPLEKAFAYCFKDKNDNFIDGSSIIEHLGIRKYNHNLNICLINGMGFDLWQDDKIFFQKDDANVNQAYMTPEQYKGNKWGNSSSYKNLSGTISIERVDS